MGCCLADCPQAVLRWYCLSQALQRQQLQQHWAERRASAAQTSARRAVLLAWAAIVADRRFKQQAARQSAAIAFCDAFVVHSQRMCMAKAFRAWSQLCTRSAMQAVKASAQEAALQLEHCCEALDVCRRDAAAAAERDGKQLAQAAERLRELEEAQQRLEQREAQVTAQLVERQQACSDLEHKLQQAVSQQEVGWTQNLSETCIRRQPPVVSCYCCHNTAVCQGLFVCQHSTRTRSSLNSLLSPFN